MDDTVTRQTQTIESLTKALAGGWDESLAADVIAAIKRGLDERPKTTRPLTDAAYLALEKLSADDATELTREALWRIAQSAHQDIQFTRGLVVARCGIVHARHSAFWMCRFLHYEGVHLSNLGRYEAALESLTHAVEIAQEQGDDERAGYAWITIAYTCFNAFHLPLAEAIYERIRSETRFEEHRTIATGNLVSLALDAGDAERALQLAQAALEMASTLPQPMKRSVVSCYLNGSVCALAALGRGSEALDVARHARELAGSDDVDSYVGGHSRFAEGVALCAAGSVNAGTAILKEILVTARSNERAAFVRRTLDELVRTYERNGEPEQALRYLREALELNKEARRAQMNLQHRFAEISSPSADGDRSLATRQAVLEGDVRNRIEARMEMAVSAGMLAGYDESHIYRRSRLARLAAKAAGWDDEKTDDIVMAARMIDVGMIAIPDSVLRKPRLLSTNERQLVSEHTSYGAELLRSAKLSRLEIATIAARHHHERWDGSGTPDGLAAEAIPIEARLIALCDVFEALTHDRPWRKARPVYDALKEIEFLAGSWFDPTLAKVFVVAVHEAFSNVRDWEAFLSEEGQSSAFVKTKQLLARLTRAQEKSEKVAKTL
jgi:HD-GYP domain-containing protein (c-di-GMP phosphodiesterase class II)